ncbi:hypothetical protein GGR42_000316 [Saonia flava]|uniref:Cytochrome c domain-containing protein n=1 Tax=Saonia flava TaxID=523696 RepID=A0A846QXM2_9FLAO|nr:VCBS repeat-containing protein [Saonia flava]NJB69854.1 hypothetical protein [Saonia flava]
MSKKYYPVYLLITLILSCAPKKEKTGENLYKTYCASCHIAPNIEDLPKGIWEKAILPEMGARLGIRENGYSPYAGLPFGEQSVIIATGLYPSQPIMPLEDWAMLKEYVLALAPDSLPNDLERHSEELTRFKPKPITLDSVPGSYFTFMNYSEDSKKLELGTVSGQMLTYDFMEKQTKVLGQVGSPITSFSRKENQYFVTSIGILTPSDMVSGRIFNIKNGQMNPVHDVFHRPVNTLVLDLNKDGTDEIVVCEYGNLKGELALLTSNGTGQYQKKTILNQPGAIKVVPMDMDKDGREDLVVLTGQGDEGITILYQQDDLNFKIEKAIRYSPVYGSSWFEMIDYEGDGDMDIVVVNGDNADDSYVHKPYHGMRIHINNGENEFKESYFYPLNGATRVVARDFDQDGDFDFGLIASFPDYENNPEFSFVYLENEVGESFSFKTYTFKDSNLGKWFLMDVADIDEDGDEDIILSSFTYPFGPVIKEMVDFWNEKNVDLMVLENELNN